jgi:hypothetical protein
VQPLAAHEHWHVDVSYLNLGGTFYYLCSLLDGYSRLIVHWEIRERMTERDVETIVQRGLEKFPDARPRIISDNGPQFIARDFKEFVGLSGITHVRTSPYYPQSNGKLEPTTAKRGGARTAHSRANGFVSRRRRTSTRREALSNRSSRITTKCGCTARWVTSRRRINWRAESKRSSPSALASSKRPGNDAAVTTRQGAANERRQPLAKRNPEKG